MFRKDSTGRSESSRPANPVKRLSTAALAAVLSIAMIVPQAWANQNTVQTTLDSQSQQLEVEQGDESNENTDTQADEPIDWTDSFDRLTLSSETGLSVDDASDEQKQSNASLTELPEQIAATLGLDVALKVGRTIIADDYFYASLPDGLTAQTYAADDADDETKQNATFDVLQRSDDQDTDVKIAEARFVTQSRLKVTFVASVNVNTGETVDSIEEASARLQLNVYLDSSLVKNKSSELKWTLQTKVDDSANDSADADDSANDSTGETTTREAKLVIPAKKQIAAKLGITLKSNNLSRSAAPLPATINETVGETDGETSKTYTLSGSQQSTFVTLWADNNADDRPQLENIKGEYRLYFILDGQTYPLTDEDGITISSEAQSQLGMTQDQLNAYMSDGSLLSFEEAGNQYNITSVNLPDTVTITDGAATETKSVVFSIKHDGIVENQTCYEERYVAADEKAYPDYAGYSNGGKDGKECLQLTEDVTFNLKLGIGNEYEELLNDDGTVNYSKWTETWGDCNTLTISWVGEDGTTRTRKYGKGTEYLFSDLVKEGLLTFSINQGDGTAAIQAENWAKYHPDGNPLTYSLTVNCEESTGTYKDYYQVSYDNAGASDHGSDTTALYNGGTVTIIHAGTTSFDATKVWLDENPSDRPATEYTLWRYSSDGSTADNAAQVRATDGSFVTFSMSAEENQALGESASVDLGEKLRDKYSDGGKLQLAKYDANGYPYIYLLRESKPDGYERVYGNVGEDGSVTDMAPNYYDRAHENTISETDEFTRNSKDISVYNNGTITNRRKDDTSASVTKTWKAGSFQDQLKEIEVTLTLQRILKADTSCADSDDAENTTKSAKQCDASDGKEWQTVTDGNGDAVTKILKDWYAEKLTQTVSGTYDKYDSLGRQYVYRWVETGVAQEDYDTQFKIDGDSTSFKLQLKDVDDATTEVDFVGGYNATTNTITNRYVAETDTHVVKKWLNSQGEEIGDPSEDSAYKNVSSVKIKLLQDGELVGTYELDGTVDGEATKITELGDDAQVQETSAWHLDFTGLPLYDSEGRKHTYMTIEVSGNYAGSFEYDHATRTKTITNRPPDGEHTRIAVAKKWVDDGNSSQRFDITAGIYALKDLASKDGTVVYKAGDQMTTVTLSEHNQWYGEASINGISGTLTLGTDYEVREIAVDGSKYEVVTSKSEIEDNPEKYADLDYRSLLPNWDNDNARMLTTDKSFAYEITYSYNKDLGCAQITNRRIGQVWIDVVKTWTDDGATKENRPNASFTLTCDEYADEKLFHADDDGSIYVTLPKNPNPDEKLYVFTDGGDGTSESVVKLKVTDGSDSENAVEIVDGGKGLKVTVCDKDKVKGEAHIHLYAFPKYDYGAILHYSVTETMPDDSKGDYVGNAATPEEVLSSPWRFHDKAKYAFDNQRVGTKDVTFHTKWYDTYVNETLNQRPDVYLTLCRTVYDYSNLDADGNPAVSYEPFDDYEAYAWQTDSENRKSYNQKAVIKNLPKYDDHGREIFYYATAKTSVADSMVTNLGYNQQFFTYGESGDDNCVGEYCGTTDWDDATAADTEKAAAAKSIELTDQTSGGINLNQAIREDGTINFTISGTMLAQGEKLWKNVPTGFKETDLPKISVHVQRRMAGGQYQSSDGTMVSTCSVSDANAGTCVWSGTETDWSRLTFQKVTDDDGNITGYQVIGVGTGVSQDVADGVSEVASTNTLTKVSTNRYAYTISRYGVNGTDESTADSLPKYDKFGRRYEYRAREIIDGLINYENGSSVPGGFDITDMIDTDETSETLSNKVYKISHGETGSFVIENTYSSSKGSLQVTKKFQGRTDADTKYPDVTFRLYRSYVTSDGTQSAKTLVGTRTLTGNQVTQCSTSSIDSTNATQGLAGNSNALSLASSSIGASGNGCGTVTFGDLDIFTPGGQYWIYTVEEDSVNGYTSDSTSITLNEPADGANPAGTPVTPDDSTLELSPNTGVKDAVFTNTYTAEDAALTGTKVWNDRGNQLNTRPDTLTLKLTRADQDGTLDPNLTDGVVGLSSAQDCTKNCLTWVKNSNNTWTYNITKVDRWAPNGKLWKYTVQEVLSTDADSKDSQYTAKNANGGSVNAGDSTNPAKFPNNLENYLTTTASVQKKWSGDNKDERNQRPKVYVELQAKITNADGGTVQDWARADTALKAVLGDSFNTGQFESSQTIEQFWSPGNRNMNDSYGPFTWTNLAVQIYDTDGTAYNVSWRAVETKLIYDNSGTQITVNIDSPDDSGAYQAYRPYQPSQTTSGTTTTITNTLENTTVYATKTWDDQSNAWVTRPGTASSGATWTTTFRLQRKTENTEWAWVTKYGATVANGFDSNVVKVTVSGNGADSATGTFANLPSVSNDGSAYQYRLVEELTGSYQVDGGTVLACKSGNTVSDPSDGACAEGTNAQLVVTDGDAMSESAPQTFTNKLQTVTLSGTKMWNDYGTGLFPESVTADEMSFLVKLTVQRRISGGEWENVTKTENGQSVAPTITWQKNADGSWTFTTEDMPKNDTNGNVYQYRAVEESASAQGFYPVYGSEDSSARTDDGNWQNVSLTNTATRFKLNKIGDDTTGSAGEALNGVELQVQKDGKLYAIWQRDENGAESSRTWVNGTSIADDPDGGVAGTTDGYIIGLPAGTYDVKETKLPNGHVKVGDFQMTVASDGAVTLEGSPAQVAIESSGSQTDAIITVTDSVFRTQLKLDKTFTHNDSKQPVSGMTFDLYKMMDDSQSEADVKIAEITTDADGTWSSAAHNDVAWLNGEQAFGDLAKYYANQSDGVPAGTYYVKETGSTFDTVDDIGKVTTFTLDAATLDSDGAHGNTFDVTVENSEFNAAVRIAKIDAETGSAIDGAKFTLEYVKSGSAESTVVAADLESGKSYAMNAGMSAVEGTSNADSGVLEITGLKKGSYTLTETANQGYAVSNKVVAKFTIDNADNATTFDLAKQSDRDAINATDVDSSIGENGLTNQSLRGTISLTKTAADDATLLNGVTFKVQHKSNGAWIDVDALQNLQTGNTYAATVEQGSITGITQDTDGSPGVLMIRNLPWGTYRFVETSPQDGYSGQDSGGLLVSGEITLDRNSFGDAGDQDAANAIDHNTSMTNAKTSLTISKSSSESGAKLAGAEFTITPAEGSHFADNTASQVLTTDENGNASISGQLVAGNSYLIEETKAPAGYKRITGTLKITVKNDGSIVKAEDSTDAFANGSVTLNDSAVIEAKDEPITFSITKKNADGTTLQGAVFTLTPKPAEGDSAASVFSDGSADAITLTTGEDGKASLPNAIDNKTLVVGNTYTLEETVAPAGYIKVDSALTFTVQDDGSLQVVGDVPAAFSTTETIGEIAVFTGDVANDPTRFYMTKVSATDTSRKLSGAVFELTGIFAGQTSATTKEMTTDETGVATIDKAQLVADGQTEYTLTETQAPNGYLRITQSYTFTVATDGTITPTKDVTGYSVNTTGENATFTVTAADTPIALKLVKEAADLEGNPVDGQKLAGAVFTITPAADGETFADGTSEITVTTDDEGSAQLSAQFIAGHSYNVKETTAPAGYQMTDVTYMVAIDDQGNATWSLDGQTIGTDGKDGLFPQATDGEHQAVAIVTNKVALATMPHSGKIFGLSPISVAGLLLIAAGITAMAIARRRRDA